MFTTETIDRFVTLAGPDYAWPTMPGHRLSTAPRAGLRVFLYGVQSGLCAACGDTLGEGWELSHIVSGGADRKGWHAGNIFAGCRECNEIDATNGFVIAFDSIIRPDLIATEWPATPILARMGEAEKAERENRKAEKRIRRGF